jgi:hypothetical protein
MTRAAAKTKLVNWKERIGAVGGDKKDPKLEGSALCWWEKDWKRNPTSSRPRRQTGKKIAGCMETFTNFHAFPPDKIFQKNLRHCLLLWCESILRDECEGWYRAVQIITNNPWVGEEAWGAPSITSPWRRWIILTSLCTCFSLSPIWCSYSHLLGE